MEEQKAKPANRTALHPNETMAFASGRVWENSSGLCSGESICEGLRALWKEQGLQKVPPELVTSLEQMCKLISFLKRARKMLRPWSPQPQRTKLFLMQ